MLSESKAKKKEHVRYEERPGPKFSRVINLYRNFVIKNNYITFVSYRVVVIFKIKMRSFKYKTSNFKKVQTVLDILRTLIKFLKALLSTDWI